jgi:hypothetical protein
MALKRVTFFLEDRQMEGLKKLSGVTRVKGSDYFRERADTFRALSLVSNMDLHLCTSFLLTMNVFFNQSISWGWRSGKH